MDAIETTGSPPFRTRHASTLAAGLLLLSVAAAVATLWVDRSGAAAGRLVNDPLTSASELLCYGVVGAVLISRRPDLPFGWILGLAATADIALVGIGVPALALAGDGRGGQLAVWGVGLGVLQWVPAALEGVVNVRFPSGRPSGTLGRWLDRALCLGIGVALVGNYLGDSVTRDAKFPGISSRRFVDGTWLTPIGNATLVLIPALILLAALAGIGVVVRCLRASGVERAQLQWRVAGVVTSVLLFPFAFTGVLAAPPWPSVP